MGTNISRSPVGGWRTPELETVFSLRPGDEEPGPETNLSKDAITGAPVGSVIGGILLLGGGVYLFRRRRQRAHSFREIQDAASISAFHEIPAEKGGQVVLEFELPDQPRYELSEQYRVEELPGEEEALRHRTFALPPPWSRSGSPSGYPKLLQLTINYLSDNLVIRVTLISA